MTTTSSNLIPPGSQGIDAIAELAARAVDPTVVPGGSTDLALVYAKSDGDVQVVDLQHLREKYKPQEKAGRYVVTDVDSFIAYFGKHAEPDAEVWVNSTGARAVLNAHKGAPAADGWRPENHVLELKLTPSPEWVRWAQASGKLVQQDAFAEWLEGAARDILVPDFATVLEVAQSLEANSKVEFKSSYRTDDGQRAFRYEETTNAKAGHKGELEIPSQLQIALRPYVGMLPVTIAARFRYRIQSEALYLGIVIDRIPEILEQAVDGIVDQLSADLPNGGIVLRA